MAQTMMPPCMGMLDGGENLMCPAMTTGDGVEATISAPSKKNPLRSPILDKEKSRMNLNTNIIIIGKFIGRKQTSCGLWDMKNIIKDQRSM